MSETPETGQYCIISNITSMPDLPDYQELNFTTEEDYTTYITRLVDRASRQIDRYTKRPNNYFNGGATITEYHDGKGVDSGYGGTARSLETANRSRIYLLNQSPVVSIDTILQSASDTGEVPLWTDALSPYQLVSETGEIIFSSTININAGYKNIQIIYVAGYETVPDEIQQACEEIVANAVKKALSDNFNARVRLGGKPATISMTDKTVFTDEIKEMLAPYQQSRF